MRFEGDPGRVETGDSGKVALSSPELFAGRKVAEFDGYPATFHIREFLDCVTSRAAGQRRRRLPSPQRVRCP